MKGIASSENFEAFHVSSVCTNCLLGSISLFQVVFFGGDEWLKEN